MRPPPAQMPENTLNSVAFCAFNAWLKTSKISRCIGFGNTSWCYKTSRPETLLTRSVLAVPRKYYIPTAQYFHHRTELSAIEHTSSSSRTGKAERVSCSTCKTDLLMSRAKDRSLGISSSHFQGSKPTQLFKSRSYVLLEAPRSTVDLCMSRYSTGCAFIVAHSVVLLKTVNASWKTVGISCKSGFFTIAILYLLALPIAAVPDAVAIISTQDSPAMQRPAPIHATKDLNAVMLISLSTFVAHISGSLSSIAGRLMGATIVL
jgi:hypothetical protein